MYPKEFYETSKLKVKNGSGFILMPFAPEFKEVHEAIDQALAGEELAFSVKRGDDVFGGGHIIDDIMRSISEAEIIVADLTTKNPNVFYELGIVHMVKNVNKVIMITQSQDDVPFDIRPFRFILYQKNEQGLSKLKNDLVEAVKAVAPSSFRITVKQGEPFKFPRRILGKGRYMYDFTIPEIMVGGGGAKFEMGITCYALQAVPETTFNFYGIACGESIKMEKIPYSIRLDRTEEGVALFTLIAESRND
jgi:hypothetical protein